MAIWWKSQHDAGKWKRQPEWAGNIIQGHLFIPFHYGYWYDPQRKRAANELTITGYDPVSKQPFFKFAAAKIRKMGREV